MATGSGESNGSSGGSPSLQPFFYLLSAVLLLSTVPTVTKYVFQHSSVDSLGMALIRVTTGFFFLLAITLVQDRRGLSGLTAGDIFQLTLLGGLGVGSYVIAAWGLRLTSVTHYVLIYSLVSPLTALFSILLRKIQSSPFKLIGIVISLIGCGIAMAEKLANFQEDFGLGDLLILLFTLMMAAHLIGSANIVKRIGAITANTVMFGSSAVLLLVVDAVLEDPPSVDLSVAMVSSLLYIGVATASVFLLRYRALQSICPATVAVYQNLAPVGGILVAHLYLGERIQLSTMVGGAIILVGAELVRRANQPGWPASYFWAKRCLGSLVGRTFP